MQIFKIFNDISRLFFLENFNNHVVIFINNSFKRNDNSDYRNSTNYIKLNRSKYNEIILEPLIYRTSTLLAQSRPLEFVLANQIKFFDTGLLFNIREELSLYTNGLDTELKTNIGAYQEKIKKEMLFLLNPLIYVSNVFSFIIKSFFSRFDFKTSEKLVDSITFVGTVITCIVGFIELFNYFSQLIISK